MSNTVPEGWSKSKLGEVAKLTMGQSPSSDTYNTEKDGLPFFQGKADFGARHPRTRYWCSEPSKVAGERSILFSVRAPVGEVNITPHECCIGRGLAGIQGETADQEFLFQKLQYVKPRFQLLSQGSTFEAVNGNEMREFDLTLPPLPEQQKIATILSSVDDVIEKTRAQIDKLKDLKTGMMQELLTKGIGSGGVPHTEFKDSPVGRIPVEWSTVNLESLLAEVRYPMRSGPFGSSLLKHELVETGIPYLGIDNVHMERFEKNYKRFVSDQKFEELSRYAVRESDVMVTIMGTVGRCCVVPTGVGRALSSKHVWTMTFDQEKYIPELICWQINYATWVQDQFKNESQGGVMESISSKTLKSLLVPLPPLPEQRKIAEAHLKTSKVISEKSEKLTSLMNLKKALMQDLLTGKVRVKTDQGESVVA